MITALFILVGILIVAFLLQTRINDELEVRISRLEDEQARR